MKKNPFVAGLLASGFIAFTASADVLNIDFDAPNRPDDSATFSGQAAAPDLPGYFTWNSVSQSGGAVNDSSLKTLSSGAAWTEVGISIDDVNGSWAKVADQETMVAGDLMVDYIYIIDKTVTATISGLVGGNLYDLYLYGQGDNHTAANRNGAQNAGFTIGDQTLQTQWDMVPGGNGLLWKGFEFVVFKGVEADGDGNISFDWFNPTPDEVDKDGNESKYAGMNGLQIVGDFAVVPEPTSMALLGLGGLMLIQTARRRR